MNEVVKNIPMWQYVMAMGGYFAFLMLLISYMRKHYKFANYFWIGSLLTFPLWLMGGVVGWFRWAKILSVIIPTIIVGFARVANNEENPNKFYRFFKGKWTLKFFYGILFLNILEATLKDFGLGNYTNAIVGVILCITIPLPMKYWEMSKDKVGDLLAYTTIGWNALYTTWNMCFVYGESPNYFSASLCILLAAEIYPIIKKRPELYITARIYTLAAHLLIRAIFPTMLLTMMDSTVWYNDNVKVIWGAINIAFGLVYLGLFMKKSRYTMPKEVIA